MDDNPLSLIDIPVIEERVITQKVANNAQNLSSEMVLIFPERGEVKVINETGAFIWNLIDGMTSIGDIVSHLQKTYSISRLQAEKDALNFLNSLIEREIIKILPSKNK